jgi:nucleoside-diphosphate-sugar epimerase
VRVAVTGATGFIGRTLVARLAAAGTAVRAVVREPAGLSGDVARVGDLGPDTDWTSALRGIEAVIHLAARVHVLGYGARDPLDAFRRANVLGTERLARACAEAGVRRLVFVSSIKVNGDTTTGRPLTESTPPAPSDPYSVSKSEGERALREVARATGLEGVVVRPCLVYGPGVKGNLARLLGAIHRGLPLPFGSIRNHRSLVGVENLCDLLERCAVHPRAAGETFLASDGTDVSTPELVRALASGMGRPARLVSVPRPVLGFGAGLIGARAAWERVCGSLQVDSAKARAVLGWTPDPATEAGLRRTGAWYRETRR